MYPANEPLIARRNARYAEEWTFAEDDGSAFDFTDYTGALQVRLYGAQAGDAKIAIANVTTDVEGVRIIEPAQGIIRIRIDQSTLEAAFDDLIGDNEVGSSIPLVYDLRLIGPDGAEEVWMEGIFTIDPGVTV